MTINLNCEINPGFHFHYRELAAKVIERALDMEQFPYEAEISLTLVDNERMHEINKATRKIDMPTDVLSFPMLDYPGPADYSELDSQLDFAVNPDSQEIILGDIVISVERVRSQAKEYGHSEKREYAFLITHSMLHLMGFDHMIPEEAQVMEEHQRRILDSLKIKR